MVFIFVSLNKCLRSKQLFTCRVILHSCAIATLHIQYIILMTCQIYVYNSNVIQHKTGVLQVYYQTAFRESLYWSCLIVFG